MPTIINGGSRGAGWWWSRHLQDAEKNEKVELIEIVGLTAENIPDAFREMYALAKGSKARNYFYEYDINPSADEKPWTEKQWAEAHDTTRHNLGHDGQPYFRVRHTKPDGRIHEHGISFRIDLETMKAIPDSLTARIHEQTSRELEIKFGMQQGKSILVPDRDFPRPPRLAKKSERFRGAQSGIDPHDVARDLAAIKARCDNGQSFRAALEATGNYALARGDKRDFVVIDLEGDDHSLGRRLGIKAAALRDFMKDVDPASLPSVKQAKELQDQRRRSREQRSQTFERRKLDPEAEARKAAAEVQERVKHWRGADAPAAATTRTGGPQNGREGHSKPRKDGPENSASKRETGTKRNMRGAWQGSKDAGDLIAALAAQNIRLARVTADEARASREQSEVYRQQKRQKEATSRGRFAALKVRYTPRLTEGEIMAVDGRGHAYRFDKRTTGAERGDIAKRLSGVDAGFLLSVADTKNAMRAASRAAARAAWIEKQQAERQKRRPATAIEQKIINCENRARMSGSVAERDGQSVTLHGAEAFADALDKAGIAIVRVKPEDQPALDALRRDEEFSRLASDVNREAGRARRFDKVEAGDIAAVDKRGNVYKLNPYKLDLEDIEARLIDATKSSSSRSSSTPPPTSSTLPGVIAARAGFEIRAEATSALWQQRRADNQARAAIRAEARDTLREIRSVVDPAASAVRRTVQTVDTTLFKSARGGLSAAAAFLGSVADKITGLFDFLAGPTAPPTRQEAEGMQRAADERHAEAADLAAIEEREEARDWQQHAQKTQEQEKNLSFAQRYGTPPTAEANLGREHDDERERGRELER